VARDRKIDDATGTETTGHEWDGIEELDDRSRDIIQSRWLIEPKITLQELADKYGVSAERIRQLEGAALKKLKAHFAA